MIASLEQFQEYIEKGLIDEENIRYEQIGNVIYLMSVPTEEHESIVGEVYTQFRNYFRGKFCQAYTSNTGLDLFNKVSLLRELEEFQIYFKGKLDKGSENIYLLPDIEVICDRSKGLFGKNGYKGVPKLIVEVLSSGTADKDLKEKLKIYEFIGVSEYWIIKDIRNVSVYLLDGETKRYIKTEYTLDSLENNFLYQKNVLDIPVKSFEGLTINLDEKIFNFG